MTLTILPQDRVMESGHCSCNECQECANAEGDIVTSADHDEGDTQHVGHLREQHRRGTNSGIMVAPSSLAEMSQRSHNFTDIRHPISTTASIRHPVERSSSSIRHPINTTATIRHLHHRSSTSALLKSNLHNEMQITVNNGEQSADNLRCCRHTTRSRHTHDGNSTCRQTHLAKQASQSSLPPLSFYQTLQSGGNGSTPNISRSFAMEMREARAKAILVDRFSRVFFPLSFTILNILYWYVYFEW